MKKKTLIKIDELIKDLVPKEFKTLEDVTYTLTKTKELRSRTHVYQGQSVTGKLKIIGNTLPMALVYRNNITFIRTSPIVEVLDQTKTILTFRTEGGVYELERLPE
jgi:hypothetical protein